MKRLILRGSNLNFEDLPAQMTLLTFDRLLKRFNEKLAITIFEVCLDEKEFFCKFSVSRFNS